MNANEILSALRARDCNFSLIADAIQVSASLVSRVASRKTRSKRVARAIAAAIRAPVEDVFPDVPAYAPTRQPDPRSLYVQRLRHEINDATVA